jgi:ABC-2 type transport system permease protein
LLHLAKRACYQHVRSKGLTLATAVAPDVIVRTSEPPRLHPLSRLRELAADRGILGNLVRKEVKVKYTSSALGAAWSMLNPILYLAVFSLVFGVILSNHVPHFPVYLLSGLLAWNLFSTSLSLGARSVVDNANLVTKVYFPREILPFASIGAALVDFVLQAVVLVAFMILSRSFHLGLNLLLLPLALAALLAFTAALTLWVAALNVRYRDTQHLLNLALLMWFWLTPVVYPSGFLYDKLNERSLFGINLFNVSLANPVADVVFGFQRALYGVVGPVRDPATHELVHRVVPVSVGWLALLLGAVTVGSLALLLLAWRTFFRLSGDFAEEL